MRAKAINTLQDRLARFNDCLSRAACQLAAALLAAMTLLVLIQVGLRYGVGDALGWSEELGKSLMVWTAFLVAPWGYRHGAHGAIDMLVAPQPLRLRLVIRLAMNLLVMLVLALLLVEAWALFMSGLSTRAATMPVMMAWFYWMVPAGLAALVLVGVELIWRDLRGLISGVSPDQPFTDHQLVEGE